MLRPERMSRVSVTGSKRVLDDVIETVHDLNLLHLSDYDGSWEGFSPGDPLQPADETSERLVTVRAIESILGVDANDVEPAASSTVVADDFEAELGEIRGEVNDLDDRRDELRDELRSIAERAAAAEPFVDLGIDLDMLWGYESLVVRVGEGDPETVTRALDETEGIAAYEVFEGEDALAIFAYPSDGNAVEEALVGTDFAAVEVPEVEGSPAAYLDELERERDRLEGDLAAIEGEIEGLRDDAARFLLAAEERLTIQVQKAEAPLNFATTENAFVAEGWVPTARYDELETALRSAVGDRVEVEEMERADFDRDAHGHGEHAPERPTDESPAPGPAAADGDGTARETSAGEEDRGERESVTDGGVLTMGDDEPPVVQNNPRSVKPFELLTQAVGRPNYSELDPTVIIFLTFPLMFGFMIGDIGYGLIYTGIGVYVYRRFDSRTWKNFGIVAGSAGVMTIVFGILYGEFFGLHVLPAVIEKGLSPAGEQWALAWFVVTAVFGIVHMSTAYTFEFVENYSLHGLREAILETGSWLLALIGLWLYIFSDLQRGTKPELLFTVFGSGEEAAIPLGFSGLPVEVGFLGIGMLVLGALLIALGPTHELIEIHVILAHTLSYLRIAAVLLAKAGMAFAVNLLVFGAYVHHGEYHFMLTYGPGYVATNYPDAEVLFGGMMHGGPALLVAGVVVLVIGHMVVLALGVTSAGIQSIRLEYFEFFSKFYEGGGTVYSPFGHERQFTAEE